MYFYLGIIIIIIGILAFAGMIQRALIKTTLVPAQCLGCVKSSGYKGPASYYPVFEFDMYGKRYKTRSLLYEYKKKSEKFANGTWHYILVSTKDPRTIFHRALTIWDHIWGAFVCSFVIAVGIIFILK